MERQARDALLPSDGERQLGRAIEALGDALMPERAGKREKAQAKSDGAERRKRSGISASARALSLVIAVWMNFAPTHVSAGPNTDLSTMINLLADGTAT